MDTNNNGQTTPAQTVEDYSKAMNFIGQSLLSALSQILEQLPSELRNKKVVTQGLSAFLTNVIYKQSPNDQESCKEMLAELTNVVRVQLKNVPQ